MATRTQRTSSTSNPSTKSSNATKPNVRDLNEGKAARDSSFQWGSPGAIAGAALGGAIIAVAANLGRKAAV